MIIKSHVRGGWSSIRDYLKNEGSFSKNKHKNEVVRLIGGKHLGSQDLTSIFQEMWLCTASGKRALKTPVHHVSINPDPKDRKLTDTEVWQIVERLEKVYGYDKGQHQTVVMEHVYKGRQHFHVVFNRVNLRTRRGHWPGTKDCGHKLRSKKVAREVEKELGLIVCKAKRKRTSARLKIQHDPTSRPTRHYAGLLGEIAPAQQKKGKREKTGKGDGSGGGKTTGMSALKSSTKPQTQKVFRQKVDKTGKGNGPERRHKNMWVAVERRDQRLKPT